MDQTRRDAINEKTIKYWFDLFNTTRLAYNIANDDIYNIDEKGYMKGVGDKTKVIVPVNELEAFSAQLGNRE